MVSCVNLCYCVNLFSQVIQYQKQSNMAFPFFVKSKRTNGLGRTHDLWLYLLGLGHQMAFPRKSTKSPSFTRHTFWKTLSQTICIPRFVHTCSMPLLRTFPNLPPTCCEICIQILDQTAISTDSYHPGSIKAQERLWRSSPDIILAGLVVRQPYYSKSFHEIYDTKKQLCQLCCMEWQAGLASRLDRTNMAVLIVEGRIHQFVTTYS